MHEPDMVYSPSPGEDAEQVRRAAAALRISEYDFFHLAFCRWHGYEPTRQRLEKVFAAYLFTHRVPPWTRQIARELLALKHVGQFDPRLWGLHRYRAVEPPVSAGRGHLGLTVSAFFLFYWALLGLPSGDSPMAENAQASQPGPCVMGGEPAPVLGTLATLVTGAPPNPCVKDFRRETAGLDEAPRFP